MLKFSSKSVNNDRTADLARAWTVFRCSAWISRKIRELQGHRMFQKSFLITINVLFWNSNDAASISAVHQQKTDTKKQEAASRLSFLVLKSSGSIQLVRDRARWFAAVPWIKQYFYWHIKTRKPLTNMYSQTILRVCSYRRGTILFTVYPYVIHKLYKQISWHNRHTPGKGQGNEFIDLFYWLFCFYL